MSIKATHLNTVEKVLDNGNILAAEYLYDDCCENPRAYSDTNLGTILIAPSLSHWVGTSDDIVDPDISTGGNPKSHWNNIRKALKLREKEIVAYPITKYQHGDIVLYLGDNRTCPFDSCICGFIYTTKENARKWLGEKRITEKSIQDIEEIFKAELESLEHWLNGECYSVAINLYTEEGELLENIDICSGFIGSDHAEEHARTEIEYYAKTFNKENKAVA